MEFIIALLLFAGVLFFVSTTLFMMLAVFAGWVAIALGRLLRPILAPIVRVLDTRLW
jgi:hypothetical protein